MEENKKWEFSDEAYYHRYSNFYPIEGGCDGVSSREECEKKQEREDDYGGYETEEVTAIEFKRIRALRDIPEAGVKKGDLGGWIQTAEYDGERWYQLEKTAEQALSQEGSCWLDPGVVLYADCKIEGNTQLKGFSWIEDQTSIKGNTVVKDSRIYASEINDGKIKDSKIEKSLIDNNVQIENYEIYNSHINTNTKIIATEEEFPYPVDEFYELEEKPRVKYQIKNSCIDEGLYLKNDSVKDATVFKTEDNKIAFVKEMPVIQREKKKVKVNLRPTKKKAAKSNDMER